MKFIILATQRSGTTFLTSILDQHPQLVVHPEVFLHDGAKYSFYAYWSRRLGEDPGLLAPETSLKLHDFLEVSNPTEPFRSNLMKINPHRLEDLNSNFDELEASLRGSEFAGLLSD